MNNTDSNPDTLTMMDITNNNVYSKSGVTSTNNRSSKISIQELTGTESESRYLTKKVELDISGLDLKSFDSMLMKLLSDQAAFSKLTHINLSNNNLTAFLSHEMVNDI